MTKSEGSPGSPGELSQACTRHTGWSFFRPVPGGAATILFLPLDPRKRLASLKIEASLYGIVVALLAATLVRPV